MRILYFFILLKIVLFARENPFFPINESNTPSYTTNKIKKIQPFTKASIELPNSARILQKISITFINLDGSQETKTISINKKIDWHYSLDIIQKTKPLQTDISQKKIKFKKIGSLKFISFFTSYKKLKIQTQDKLIRNFKIVDPDRIVLDFKKELNFRSYQFHCNQIFKKIRIGNHDGYYRVVLELDGKYTYTIKKTDFGYLLILE